MLLLHLSNWNGNKAALLRTLAGGSLLLLLLVFQSSAFAFDDEKSVWPALKQNVFGDTPIRDNASDLLTLEAPKRAEDAAIVPVTIRSLIPQTASRHISQLHLFIDNNPMPHAASFTLSPALEQVDLSTRVRVDSYTHMRVIAELNDGSLHMVKTFVKASGGCSAPAGKDQPAALERLGKMQIRMRPVSLGEATPVQVIVSHPNNSGLQMDQVTRGYIPAHFVNTLSLTFNDEPLLSMQAGISLSEDPSLRFVFTPSQTGQLRAQATDSKGQHFHQEKSL